MAEQVKQEIPQFSPSVAKLFALCEGFSMSFGTKLYVMTLLRTCGRYKWIAYRRDDVGGKTPALEHESPSMVEAINDATSEILRMMKEAKAFKQGTAGGKG